jgi:hypothetical protein
MVIKIRDTQARCDFEDIAPGTYALVISHDENTNGKLDTNWLGVPTEGYGFSNDATALLGAPSFLCRQFPLRRAESRSDDQLALLNARCVNAEGLHFHCSIQHTHSGFAAPNKLRPLTMRPGAELVQLDLRTGNSWPAFQRPSKFLAS